MFEKHHRIVLYVFINTLNQIKLMSMITITKKKPKYNPELSIEENIAYSIDYAVINSIKYIDKQIRTGNYIIDGDMNSDEPIKINILDFLFFEILNKNQMNNKVLAFSHPLTKDISVKEIESHLADMDSDTKFIDKSEKSEKQYITVWLK